MADSLAQLTEQLHNEIDQVPAEFRPLLLKLVHSFREGVTKQGLPSAAESFAAGWADIKAGRVYPVDTLWEGIDAQ